VLDIGSTPVVPEIRYARAGDLSIAYQQWGSGPVVVGLPPFAQNIDVMWQDPYYRHLLERVGSFASMTQFDKRGTGLSDRSIGAPSLDERMDDFRAVMDATEIERASVVGVSEAGPMAILFAATYPERVDKLVLYGTFAAPAWKIDPAYEPLRAFVEQWIDQLAEHWGTAESLVVPSFMPSMVGDESYRRWMLHYERQCLTPKSVRDLMALNMQIDVRHALPLVQAPTLVLHRSGDLVVPVDAGRYLAEHIPGAQFIELEGADHVPWIGDADILLDHVEDFVCGERQVRVDVDRLLATVLFTDIVSSTERAAVLGDRAWRALLDRHDELLRAEIERYGGREVKTTGDGVLATFDSPGRAVRAAHAMMAAVRPLGCAIRAGLHTGEIELRGDDVAGMAVHIGARVAAAAGPEEILVSSTVRDLVLGSPLRFEERGTQPLKGVEGAWRLYAAVP
jgi:class 3 adenylate cyclase